MLGLSEESRQWTFLPKLPGAFNAFCRIKIRDSHFVTSVVSG